MNKLKNKLGVTVGAAIVAVGVMAIPAFAATSIQDGSFFTKMHSLMNQTFTSEQQQQFMNSPAVQKLHNSPEMQQAIQEQDFGKMQSLMNSDPELKNEIGDQNVARMNQMMGQFQGSFQSGK